MPTITTARTTPITIPFTLVVVDDFLPDTADAAGGKTDAPRFKAPVDAVTVVGLADFSKFVANLDEEVAAVMLVVPASNLVEEVIVRVTVLEINLPFGDRRTPVPLLQQSGELSQQ